MLGKRLRRKIEAFLQEKKRSAGGYAPVTEAETTALHAIIEALIAAKYEPDPDRDYPLEWEIVDRTRFRRSHFMALPYPHKHDQPHSPEAYEEELDGALFNLALAYRDVDTAHRCLQSVRRKKEALTARRGTIRPAGK